jgi:hypothetical protein
MLFAWGLSATAAWLPMPSTTAATVAASFALVALPKISIASATTTAAFLPLTLRLTTTASLSLSLSTVTATGRLRFVGPCAVL